MLWQYFCAVKRTNQNCGISYLPDPSSHLSQKHGPALREVCQPDHGGFAWLVAPRRTGGAPGIVGATRGCHWVKAGAWGCDAHTHIQEGQMRCDPQALALCIIYSFSRKEEVVWKSLTLTVDALWPIEYYFLPSENNFIINNFYVGRVEVDWLGRISSFD